MVYPGHMTTLAQPRNPINLNNTAPSNSIQEINEGQRITVARSVTATHTIHLDPLGDTDVEP